MKIVIATFNKGKFKEFKDLFSNSSFEILSLKDFTTQDIDETGNSYEENAMLKAKKASEVSNYPSLGDDSGLEVKLLNNDPGLFSARYSGKNATDEANIKKLLNEKQAKALGDDVIVRGKNYLQSRQGVEIDEKAFVADSIFEKSFIKGIFDRKNKQVKKRQKIE